MWVHGIFNVQKCVKYLRSVGVEISAETEAQWLDAQKSHRFLNSMKRPWIQGWDWWCANGHHAYVESKRRRRKKSGRGETCHCGARWSSGSLRWHELRDGTFMDYRPLAERWKPRDWMPSGPFRDDPTED